MKAIKLKQSSDSFTHLNNAVQTFSTVLQSHTPKKLGYSFYRCKIYSQGDSGIVHLNLLSSDINGNFSVQSLEYNLEDRILFYPPKMALFEDEDDIKDAIEAFIIELEYMPYVVSQLYFDFVTDDLDNVRIAACYMVKDKEEPGSVIAFVSAGHDFHYKYNLSEAKALCLGTALSVNWRSSIYDLLAQVNNPEVETDVEKSKKFLSSIGIQWVD